MSGLFNPANNNNTNNTIKIGAGKNRWILSKVNNKATRMIFLVSFRCHYHEP